MKNTIFEHSDYKTYLKKRLESDAQRGRGARMRLSEYIGVQPAFVSQVLNGDGHFNLEHGQKINKFLEHGPEEVHFFLLLISHARAGTSELQGYYEEQIESVRKQRLLIKNRFREAEAISEEDKSTYYSAWHYSAIRVLLAVPGFQDKAALAQRLRLAPGKVSAALDFLVSRGLAAEKNGKYSTTDRWMHLANDAPNIAKHHTNWRIRAIASLDQELLHDLHYSSAFAMSAADAREVKKILVDFLEIAKKKIHDSPSEDIFSLNLDFFRL